MITVAEQRGMARERGGGGVAPGGIFIGAAISLANVFLLYQ